MRHDFEKLPPHSDEAEQGILACVLADPEQSAAAALTAAEGLDSGEAFYDLRHREIWSAVQALAAARKPIDIIHVTQLLRDRGKLDQVGGMGYLTRLPELVLATLPNLKGYIDIVNNKALARRAIRMGVDWAQAIGSDDTISEVRIESFKRKLEALEADAARQFERDPRHLVKFEHFAEAFYNLWFKIKADEYGWPLPFPFPFRVRPSEMTLFSGDNGSGKSSLLGQLSIVLAFEGARPCIASMEVQGEVTAWIMSRQLMGIGKLDDNDEGRRRLAEAFAWLNARFSVYDFRGIADWRELLDVFRWAHAHNGNDVFVVDSVMRIGIEDDDYSTQGVAAAAFANFALSTRSHVFLVLHERKSRDGSDKERIRGSKQWSDNAHNLTRMTRNQTKAASIAEWQGAVKAGEMSEEECEAKIQEVARKWDSKFILSKQRWPASEQNASRWLFFHRPSLQFHTAPNLGSFNYLDPIP